VREHTMQLHEHIRKTWGRLNLTRNATLEPQ
jgi:hypothetical protein